MNMQPADDDALWDAYANGRGDEADEMARDAARYRFLRADAYECVVPHGNKVRGSRTGWITHIFPGPDFDAAVDAAIAAKPEEKEGA